MDCELQYPQYQHERPQWSMAYAMLVLSLQEEGIIKIVALV